MLRVTCRQRTLIRANFQWVKRYQGSHFCQFLCFICTTFSKQNKFTYILTIWVREVCYKICFKKKVLPIKYINRRKWAPCNALLFIHLFLFLLIYELKQNFKLKEAVIIKNAFRLLFLIDWFSLLDLIRLKTYFYEY